MARKSAGWTLVRGLAVALAVAWPGRADAAGAPQFGLPIDCVPGQNCFVQNYVDTDPTSGARDYLCGGATYDGHTGTDIRLRSLEAAKGVAVKAAAAGTVWRTRDGVADKIVETAADRAAVMPIGLGNTVIINHGDGWQTIYGHMRKGSVAVKSGDRVAAGARLGEVGVSGLTQFAHLHFEVRFRGDVFEPFLGSVVKGECRLDRVAAEAASVWDPTARTGLSFPGTVILESGFAGSQPTSVDLEKGASTLAKAEADAEVLIYFVRALHARAGDRFRLSVAGPDGALAQTDGEALARDKATQFAFVGRRRPATGPFPLGSYVGAVELIRNGQTIERRNDRLQLAR